ncbi:MAG: peptidoglycan-binding domain-containing protein, partial [Pseudomonadota bacterium]
MKTLAFTFACLAAATSAAADVAVFLAPDRPSGAVERQLGQAQRAYRQARFDVFATTSRSASSLAAELTRAFEAAEPGDHVVIYLSGTVLRAGSQSYLAAGPETGLSPFTVHTSALPITPVMEALSAYPARALMAVGQPGAALTLGGDEAETFAALPAGVAVVEGLPRDVLVGLSELVARDGASVAETFGDLPVAGYVPETLAFLGGPAIPREPEVVDDDRAVEDAFWNFTRATGTLLAYRAYLQRFPDGRYRTEALAAIERLDVTPEERAAEIETALGLSRAARREIQVNLGLLGFNPRGLDGIFGPGSRAAIRAWQETVGLEATGFLTGNQIVALDRAAAVRREEIRDEDRDFWLRTGARGGEDRLRAYLERYPEGLFADEARVALAAIED